jgi:hypothetical protein
MTKEHAEVLVSRRGFSQSIEVLVSTFTYNNNDREERAEGLVSRQGFS